MKKLIFALALVFGTMFVSCTCNSSSKAADSTEVVDSVAVDTTSADSL